MTIGECVCTPTDWNTEPATTRVNDHAFAERHYQRGERGDKLIHRAGLHGLRGPGVIEHPPGYRRRTRWSAPIESSTTLVKVRKSSLSRRT